MTNVCRMTILLKYLTVNILRPLRALENRRPNDAEALLGSNSVGHHAALLRSLHSQ